MSALEAKLNTIFQNLRTYLNEIKLISRIELKKEITKQINLQNFLTSESSLAQKLYEFPLPQFIFLTVTSEKYASINAPLIHEKIEYKQIIFYHSHSFKITQELLEEAYVRVCKLQIKLLHKIISNLLFNVNYNIQETTSHAITAKRENYSLKCHLFCSIIDLKEKISSIELTSTDALIIPPGSSVKPFIKFYQQHSNHILLKDASVWLVDTDDETINRFIGLPTDKKILLYFTKSQLATLIERNWRPTISEDF